MMRSARIFAALTALTVLAPVPATAEFLAPDWSTLSIEGVSPPDWFAGVREGNYIGMCTGCDGTMLLEVRVVPDDGTGDRIRSGETTAQTYTEIGEANASQMGGEAAYYGTKEIAFASAVGFVTQARTATGDFAVSYQLWSDGQQLIVRVYGKDQAAVEEIAARAYEQAAPLTFR
ncbi:hypothetical protein NO932_03395 [Pelagibacterium sp. 26DY04]|uniref:hypothetical protein n=1 Tax=Pelagibacterium sp. 26DY04 TaxID=2967130 RepID=UPI0028164A55|nr:hypothetical protein [Pelagibacterium sp. 26DY04]WMT87666.1 hypothetical protein NO932_03395 [Pelagibacterium sp. 26DY04]